MNTLITIFFLSLMGMMISPVDTASAVTLLEPKGGEVLAGGTVFKVKWEASAGEVTYELKYSINGGKQWKKITKGISGTSYDWTVPLTIANYKDCRIMIIGYNSSGKKVSEDTSDLSFAIDVVRVTSPASEEELTPGNIHTITWTTTPALTSVGQVLLKYSVNNGKKWTNIATVAGNPGSYDWNVPWPGGAFPDCKLMVELKDEKGKKVGQYGSDGVFFIGFTPKSYSDQMVSDFGEDGAFDALALAVDKGYSLPQIFDASVNGRLGLDGVITDASGKVKKPDNPPTNYFATSGLTQDMLNPLARDDEVAGQGVQDFRELCKNVAGSVNKGAVELIVALYARGYTLDQIIVAVMADEVCMISALFKDWEGKSWHSQNTCEDGYKWEVKISLYNDSTRDMRGMINFHACPGGGRANYYFHGKSDFNIYALFLCEWVDVWDDVLHEFYKEMLPIKPEGKPREGLLVQKKQEVQGEKEWGAGDLNDNTPQYQKFYLEEWQPPKPNYAP